MKLFTCLVVFRIFDITTTIKPKSVNIALETILEFYNQDHSSDVQFIDNVQTFLKKIKTVVNRHQGGRRSNSRSKENFTVFLKNVVAILKNYDDEDLEDVFAVIDNELRKYHYKGCKFYELIENNEVRRHVAVILNDVKSKSAKEIKYILQKASRVLADGNFDGRLKGLLDYINSLYRSDANYKFRSFLSNLDNYKSKSKRANLDLIKIVREGVRSILFDHYTDLNQNARRELKLKLEAFWKESKNPRHIKHKVWNVQYTRSDKEPIPRFHVIQIKENMFPLNMSLANVSMLSSTSTTTTRGRFRWTIPSKLPFNITRPTWRKPANETTTKPTKTTKRRPKTTKTKKTRKTKRPKRFKLLRHEPDYYSEGNHKLATLMENDKTRRPRRHRTTAKERVHTLWEEPLLAGSIETRVKTIISHHNAEINVEKTERPKYIKKDHERHRLKHNKHRNRVSEYHRYDRRSTSPKLRVSSRNPGTATFRKSIQRRVTSEEGMSIESFENTPLNMISFRKSNDDDTFNLTSSQAIDGNILRRINHLEKELMAMKSKIKIKAPIKTTQDRIEDNYALDFWEGTPKNEIIYNQSTIGISTPTTILSTMSNEKINANATNIIFTTNLMPVNVNANDENTTQDGAVLKLATFNENDTQVVPFTSNIDNQTIRFRAMEDLKNDIISTETNITASPILEIERTTIAATTFEKNATTHSTVLADEKISNAVEEILKNSTLPSFLLTNSHNESVYVESEDQLFRDIDMDII